MKRMLMFENGSGRAVSGRRKSRKHKRSTGVQMAARRRRRKAAPRHNPHGMRRRRRHAVVSHRRRRRNPAGISARGLMGTVVTGVKDAAFGVGGMAIARSIRSKLGFAGGTPTGAAVEVVAGVALGMFGGRFIGGSNARAAVQGAFMGPLMDFVKNAGVPVLSSALGDDMGLYGPGSSYGYLYGYPSRAALGGYPTAPMLGNEEYAEMAGF